MIVKKKKISETEMALAICKRYRIMSAEGSTNVSYYNGKTYVQVNKQELASMILSENMRSNLDFLFEDQDDGLHMIRSTKAKEVAEQVFAYARALEQYRKDDTDWISFKNGLYNIKTGEFRAHTPEIVTYNPIPHNYNPHAYCDEIDEELNVLANFDPKKKILFLEMFGYCLERQPDIGKFFLLHGGHANGKSTLLEMLQGMLGDKNVTGADLKDLCDSRFTLAEIRGKLANLGQDIEASYVGKTGTLKKIVTGDKIYVEEKGIQGYMYRPYCKLIFSCNVVPAIGKGKDRAAIEDRIVIVPMTAHFDRNSSNVKVNYGRKLASNEEAMEYLLNLSLKALKDYFARGCIFTIPAEVKEAQTKYFNDNDSVFAFAQDITVNEIAYDSNTRFDRSKLPMTINDVMSMYNSFCKLNNIKPLGNKAGEVTKRLCEIFDVKVKESTIQNRKYRYLVKTYTDFDENDLPF